MSGDTLKLALFDCDGTLVDSQHAIVSAMTAAWAGEGLGEPDPVRVRRVVGLSLVEAVARLLPDGDPVQHVRLAERYKEAFMRGRLAGRHLEPLFPGLREALEALERERVLLGVATGKSLRGLTATLAHHDLARFFVTLQTADIGPGKPDPAMVRRALAESGAEAADTVMIGDTVFDMEMARRAGVGAIGVAWGYHEVEELRAAGAQRIVGDGDGLVAAILEGLDLR
jgi:phosphoglycolate phosphatase